MTAAPLTFTVPGQPVAKARARTVVNRGRVHSFTPPKTANYENLVRMAFVEKYPNHVPIEGPIMLSIRAFFMAPKYLMRKHAHEVAQETILHISRPDLSNIFKSVEDALNGVAFVDDSAVCVYGPDQSMKLYSVMPRVEITIREIKEGV
jgi:Holliday junction resolvase RusA-like endonuclease